MSRFVLLLAPALAGCPSHDEGVKLAPLPPQAVGRLVSKEGQVELTRDGGKGPAEVGTLLDDDLLETGLSSRALVRAPGGREIELGESTRFTVHANLGEVEVGSGTITFVSDGEADGGVTRVTTPFGKSTIAPGTRASLRLGESGLTVDVAVGTIVQVEEDGGTQSVAAGQRVEFGVGKVELVEAPPALQLEVQLQPDGKVQVKKKGEARFSPARKGGQPMPDGTSFEVGPGGRAKLTVPGAAVKLSAGDRGTVNSAAVGEDGNAVDLTTTVPVGVAFDGVALASVKFTGKTPLKVKSHGEASATVHQSKLEVTAGEVELEVSGQRRVVKAGEVATATASGAEVGLRPRPPLTVPMGRGLVRVYARRGVGEVALQVPDEAARVQVASDAQFSDLLASGPTKGWVAVPAPGSGELYWRTVDASGEPSAPSRVRFLLDVGAARDGASRADTVAETGKKALIYFQGAVPTLTFTWAAIEGARGYLFRVYRPGDERPVLEKKPAEPRVTVEPGALSEGSYQWTSAALDEAGKETTGGRRNQMEIAYDNALTTLQLTSPKDGDRIDGATLSGTAPTSSKLYVNGKPVALDDKGRFSAPAPRAELLVFRLLNDGGESYWLRRLRR